MINPFQTAKLFIITLYNLGYRIQPHRMLKLFQSCNIRGLEL